MARLLVACATAALAAAAVGLPRSSNTRCKRFILISQAAQRNYTGATNAKRFASIQRQMRDLQLEKDLELVRLRARVAELEARR